MQSSNTLFHFTRSREALLSILEHTFWPSFCLETAPFEDDYGPVQNGTPIVCFCDIPLSATTEHRAVYGNYAIGLTKSWGVRKGITPILYTHAASPISSGLKALMDQGLQIGRGPINSALWDEVVRLMNFTKPYEGIALRNGVPTLTRFYDEREWRWIPQDLPEGLRFIDSSQFVDRRPPEDLAIRLRGAARLRFTVSDIRYIIVATEEEILPTLDDILVIKERFSPEEKRLLTTRVLSAQQLGADF